MMSFIHSGSEVRIDKVSSGNNLDEVRRHKPLMKNNLISFDSEAENILHSILIYLQIVSTNIYNGYPKLNPFFGFGVTDKPYFESSHRSTITRCRYSQSSILKTTTLLAKTKSIVANHHR